MAGTVWAESLEKPFKVGGHLRQETAYRVDESREWTKLRQQVLLTESGRLTPAWLARLGAGRDALKFRLSQRAWYDAVFDVTDNFHETVKTSQRWHLELRDAYLDYSQGAFDVRLGKQQIVWGDAVGLFFADVVNAKDLREYILPEFDLIRIPQWAVDVEWSGEPFHTELVWIPVREFHRLGVSHSEFEFPLPVPSGSPRIWMDPSKPPESVSNSEAGARASVLLGGWDVSGFYLYTWDKFPTLFRTIDSGTYRFQPKYRRAHRLGGSFSKAIRDVVLKGELLVTPKQHLVTYDATDTDGILRRTTVDYLIGADYTFFGQVDANVQLMQRLIADHADLMEEDDVRSHLSVWLKTEFLNKKIKPELLVITGLTEPDVLYRPKVTVTLTPHLEATIGADIFQGRPSGLFGRFDNSSRLYTQLTYYF
jgi:hypothetical protein